MNPPFSSSLVAPERTELLTEVIDLVDAIDIATLIRRSRED